LSKEELSQHSEGQELTNMIDVTGIASMELAVLGPFLKQAFTDYGHLTKAAVSSSGTDTDKENENGGAVDGEEARVNATSKTSSLDDDDDLQPDHTRVTKADRQRMSVVRSRLRRFRS
jgi:hypothetical protein